MAKAPEAARAMTEIVTLRIVYEGPGQRAETTE